MLILYNPPSSAQRKPVLPMSLLALGALLEGEHEYRIIDGNLEPDAVAAIDRTIQETGADILGATVMPGPQLSHVVPQCRELKRMHPKLTIVWGGYFPSQHFDACLQSDCVDYVLRGNGEVGFRALVAALRRNEGPTSTPGLVYRDRATGSVRANEMATVPNPDHLPDFPYHRIDMARYIRRTFMGKRTLPHHASYGCPFSCGFCAAAHLFHGRWHGQSAQRIADVAGYLVERWGADSVEFYDNNFFVQEGRTSEFAERILPLGIGWWAEARIDTLLQYSDRTWAQMRDSGLKMVFMGAESGSDETLRRMNKGGTLGGEKTLEIARKTAQFGVIPEFSFVLGNPPDPESDAHETFEFIRKLKQANEAAEIILYVYTPVPMAGELYDQAKARGFRFPETLDEWVSAYWLDFAQRRSTGAPWLNDPLKRQVHCFERVLNAYYPTATDPRLHGVWRGVLRAFSAWRYHLRFYNHPFELQALHKLVAYQRPETSGF